MGGATIVPHKRGAPHELGPVLDFLLAANPVCRREAYCLTTPAITCYASSSSSSSSSSSTANGTATSTAPTTTTPTAHIGADAPESEQTAAAAAAAATATAAAAAATTGRAPRGCFTSTSSSSTAASATACQPQERLVRSPMPAADTAVAAQMAASSFCRSRSCGNLEEVELDLEQKAHSCAGAYGLHPEFGPPSTTCTA